MSKDFGSGYRRPFGTHIFEQENSVKSRIPVLKHYRGVCHAFVDESADIDAALRVVVSAKVQRPSACNALEGLLVHRNIAPEFLPGAAEALHREQVRLLGCERSQTLSPHIEAGAEADWGREFLDLVMTVRVVQDMDYNSASVAVESEFCPCITYFSYSFSDHFLNIYIRRCGNLT